MGDSGDDTIPYHSTTILTHKTYVGTVVDSERLSC
jgi:hypothetical protein